MFHVALTICVRKKIYVKARKEINITRGKAAKLARRLNWRTLFLRKKTFKKMNIVLSCAFLYNMYFIKNCNHINI